ncbi:CatB-related O-acetyltransferase [Anaeroarcus burkinensis]|uniref:CatB-related O-acetyltransferase n=1 Tax=Anaeroarcus burkinensis TaxID=82376 RepID=UPI00041879B5|nr:CatB-related O-acetyltransferase [Anaeroarcus burkinensis]
MWRLFIDSPALMWLKWIIYAAKIRLKYPTVKLYYMASAINTTLGNYVILFSKVRIQQCSVGDYTYIGEEGRIFNSSIGKFCSIGSGVRCGLGTHPTKNFVSSHPIFYSVTELLEITFADKSYFEESRPIEIGNDVWIGTNVIIADGVKIGDGAIIAAGSVVVKDVPPYAIVGGIPAKLIRYRFEEKQIDFLLNFKWWDKELSWIRENWIKWHDIHHFMREYKNEKKISDA